MPLALPQLNERQLARFNSRLKKVGKCLEWASNRTKDGYGVVDLNSRKYLAHRIAYYLATGQDPGELQVLHECDNPPCCKRSHLFIGTQLDNIADRHLKGRNGFRARQGVDHHNSKLAKRQIISIRQSSLSLSELSKRHGVSKATISRIRNHKLWRHVA